MHLGIDIGTTSVKGILVDPDGEILDRCRLPHPLIAPDATRFEHDADRAWRQGARETVERLGRPAAESIGLAAMVPSLAAVDRAGVPVSPGLLYGDHRGRVDAGEPVGFLEWLHAAEPTASAFWPAQAVASVALGGDPAIDLGTAFATIPLFDGERWDVATIDRIGIDESRLSKVVDTAQPVGVIDNATIYAAGTIDAFAEQLVAGADDVGDVHVICGTTLIVWCVNAEPVSAPGLWTVPHPTNGLTMTGGASNAGGLFVDRVRALVGDDDLDDVDADRLPLWLPYIRGERTPLHDPDRRARLLDLDVGHGPADLLAAAYEAVGFVARHHIELGAAAPRRIVATGGGTQSAHWMQALADVTGLPVDVAADPEGAAIGAAWLGRMAAGLESDLAEARRWAGFSRTVEPRPRCHEAAARRYERFLEEST